MICGDCLEVLPTLADGSFDCVITDPPYGLVEPRSGGSGSGRPDGVAFCPRTEEMKAARRGGFMGKLWDHAVPGVPFWTAVLRVLKPGGYLLAMGGTRTYHRLTCAVEDAGFEIRDCIMWIFGSGFPKGKGCLKPGYEPILLARRPGPRVLPLGIDECRVGTTKDVPASLPATAGLNGFGERNGRRGITADDAGRNPNLGRYPANVAHDGSDEVLGAFAAFADGGQSPARFFASLPEDDFLPSDAKAMLAACQSKIASDAGGSSTLSSRSAVSVLTHAVTLASRGATALNDCRGLGESVTVSGMMLLCESVITAILNIARSAGREPEPGTPSPSRSRAKSVVRTGRTGTTTITISHWKSDGTAAPVTCDCIPMPSAQPPGALPDGERSRFNYCSKAPGAERLAADDGTQHPCVKPLALMRWLVRLVCPPGGSVLDPFAGSGTTLLAALEEGRRAVGIEKEPAYCAIAEKRLTGVQRPLLVS